MKTQPTMATKTGHSRKRFCHRDTPAAPTLARRWFALIGLILVMSWIFFLMLIRVVRVMWIVRFMRLVRMRVRTFAMHDFLTELGGQ